MTYALENTKETERLERQSRSKFYDYQSELQGFHPLPGQKLLDAGCGSGIVSRFLAEKFPSCSVSAYDGSKDRIEQAKRLDTKRLIDFQVKNLTQKFAEPQSFDAIVCRYVLEHLPSELAQQTIQNFYDSLRPNGELHIVDIDGLFYNIYPLSPEVDSFLQKLKSYPELDLSIGRKLPHYLSKAGFTNIQWRIECMQFNSTQDKKEEGAIIQERLELSHPTLVKIIGSEKKAQNFKKEYLEIALSPESTLFYNKFIVKGVKQHLKLV